LNRQDHSVIAPYALVLDREHWRAVAEAAEQLAREAMPLERELLARTDLHSRLGIPRPIRAVLRDMSRNCEARAARVMRFDFHYSTEGWRISEVNADVPGGFVEGSGLTEALAERYPGLRPFGNPAREYSDAIRRLAGDRGHVALVHATAYSDDRQVMEYLAKHLRACGLKTSVVSPAHIRFGSEGAVVESRFSSGTADALVRFFPVEWLPNLGRRSRWSGFFSTPSTGLSNPGTAVLLQTKLAPLVWDELAIRLDGWRVFLPEVRSPGDIPESERDEWVLKPALGRVGEGVVIAGVTPPAEFGNRFRQAQKQPRKWIAQRRFHCVPVETPDGPGYPCLGVFTIDGQIAGCYGRVSMKPLTDADAQDVAILGDCEDASGR
jgi:glutathionylspermidine synthase